MTDLEVWTAKQRKLNPNVSKAKGDGKARFAESNGWILGLGTRSPFSQPSTTKKVLSNSG